jgi:hypothetical protein
MSDPSRKDSTPPPDLSKEREEMLRSFRQSAALTERFMDEYARMRSRLLEVEGENEWLRSRIGPSEAGGRALAEVAPDSLRKTGADSGAQRIEARFAELEEEFAHLASLFVAGNQLHAALTTRSVVRRIRDVLGQLVGARAYTLYFLSSDGAALAPITSEGVPPEQLASVSVHTSRFGQVLQARKACIEEDHDLNRLHWDEPAALIPLVAEERAVGLIAIFGLLPQKGRFSRTDFELFRLLGEHAGPALIGASLFEQSGHRLPGAEVIHSSAL